MSAVRFRLLILTLLSLSYVDRAPSLVMSDTAPNTPLSSKDLPRASSSSSAPPLMTKLPIRFEANTGQLAEGVRFVARRSGGSLFLEEDRATLVVQTKRMEKRSRRHMPLSKMVGSSVSESTDANANAIIGLKVAGARTVVPQPSEPLETKTNYLIGNDRSKWHLNVPTFSKVTYPSVLDGVDLVYHGENGALEYDFVVAPNTNVDTVAMNVSGASNVSVTPNGDLAIHTDAGDLLQPKPLVYQREAATGVKRTVASSYRLVSKDTVGFVVASYDRSKPLVIDPVLAFSTYLGGAGNEEGNAVTVDTSGNSYVTGATLSDPFQPTMVGQAFNLGTNLCKGGCFDAFVAKLSPTGALVYATYLGGSSNDEAYGIAVNVSGEAFVAGVTISDDFPTTGGPPPTPNDPPNFGTVKGFGADSFVTRLNANGAGLGYSNYIPFPTNPSGFTDVDDVAYAIAVDDTGRAYFTGETAPNFGTLQQAAGPSLGLGSGVSSAYVARLNSLGTGFEGATRFLDGFGSEVGHGIALDAARNAYVVGTTTSTNFPTTIGAACQVSGGESTDAFVAKLETSFTDPFAYVTCLGGDGNDSGNAIAVDAAGNAFVAGSTSPPFNTNEFPIVPSAAAVAQGTRATDPSNDNVKTQDGFVAKLSTLGVPTYSTFLGGPGSDSADGIGIDSANTAWVTGTAGASFDGTTTGFPTSAGAPPGLSRGGSEAFATRVTASGDKFVFSVLFGGSAGDEGRGLAVQANSISVAGTTTPGFDQDAGAPIPGDFPTFNAAQAQAGGAEDAFLTKITVPPLLISPPSITLAALGNQTFVALGGAGYGYKFSLFTNASGGTINADTGAYTAGPTGGVTDVVQVKDAFDLTANASVQVGAITTQLVISPSSTTSPPKGTRNFTASGGTPPYQFVFASNASVGVLTLNGQYTAGTKGNVTDIIRVNDSAGNSANATVLVTAGITITPAKPATPPKGQLNFTATGGSGSGYAWTLTKASSGGNITPAGHYTAGGASSSVDTVKVTDSLGNTATVNVSVGGGLAITPADPSTTTRGAIAFTAVGGSGSYTWSLTTALSGGTIDPATGNYVAGTNGNVKDVVKATDTVGNGASVTVSVGPALTLTPSVGAVVSGGKITFAAAGGSGTGYVFSIPTNASGATIGADGVYIGGAASGIDTVKLIDSLGSSATALVTVTSPSTTPPGTIPPGSVGGFDAGTLPGINLGGGGNDDCSCRAVGSSGAGTTTGSSVLANAMTRALAALALALGLVWRRRRRSH